jgi:serine/threonine-protein kinase ATR
MYFSQQDIIELATTVCRFYGMSLSLGCRHIYQSLPRMLALWLDMSDMVHSNVELS